MQMYAICLCLSICLMISIRTSLRLGVANFTRYNVQQIVTQNIHHRAVSTTSLLTHQIQSRRRLKRLDKLHAFCLTRFFYFAHIQLFCRRFGWAAGPTETRRNYLTDLLSIDNLQKFMLGWSQYKSACRCQWCALLIVGHTVANLCNCVRFSFVFITISDRDEIWKWYKNFFRLKNALLAKRNFVYWLVISSHSQNGFCSIHRLNCSWTKLAECRNHSQRDLWDETKLRR